MLFLLTPFLFISIFLDCFSLVQRSFLRSVVRKLVRSTIFCSSFFPYHIFSFFHVLHCLRIHSFFEYNKSLCEMSVQRVLLIAILKLLSPRRLFILLLLLFVNNRRGDNNFIIAIKRTNSAVIATLQQSHEGLPKSIFLSQSSVFS